MEQPRYISDDELIGSFGPRRSLWRENRSLLTLHLESDPPTRSDEKVAARFLLAVRSQRPPLIVYPSPPGQGSFTGLRNDGFCNFLRASLPSLAKARVFGQCQPFPPPRALAWATASEEVRFLPSVLAEFPPSDSSHPQCSERRAVPPVANLGASDSVGHPMSRSLTGTDG